MLPEGLQLGQLFLARDTPGNRNAGVLPCLGSRSTLASVETLSRWRGSECWAWIRGWHTRKGLVRVDFANDCILQRLERGMWSQGLGGLVGLLEHVHDFGNLLVRRVNGRDSRCRRRSTHRAVHNLCNTRVVLGIVFAAGSRWLYGTRRRLGCLLASTS